MRVLYAHTISAGRVGINQRKATGGYFSKGVIPVLGGMDIAPLEQRFIGGSSACCTRRLQIDHRAVAVLQVRNG
jgi:hypothetical protein